MVSDDDIDALRATLGQSDRVTFEAACTVDGRPALVVMTATDLVVTSDPSGAAPPVSAPFLGAAAERRPGTMTVGLTVGDARFDASFVSAADVERLLRVLRVRQDSARAPEYELREVPAVSPSPVTAADVRRWADYTETAAVVLIVLGCLAPIPGVALALAALGDGSVGFALLWLLGVLTSSATAVCLGTLARTVVLRYRLDETTR